MHLTRFTDYSIKVLSHLATHPEQRVTIRQISDIYNISRNHLMKVVSFLSSHDYVDSQRGPGGGIQLKKPATEINLADIVVDAEGDLSMLDCMREHPARVSASDRQLRSIMTQALEAFIETLGAYSLADLATPEPSGRR